MYSQTLLSKHRVYKSNYFYRKLRIKRVNFISCQLSDVTVYSRFRGTVTDLFELLQPLNAILFVGVSSARLHQRLWETVQTLRIMNDFASFIPESIVSRNESEVEKWQTSSYMRPQNNELPVRIRKAITRPRKWYSPLYERKGWSNRTSNNCGEQEHTNSSDEVEEVIVGREWMNTKPHFHARTVKPIAFSVNPRRRHFSIHPKNKVKDTENK